MHSCRSSEGNAQHGEHTQRADDEVKEVEEQQHDHLGAVPRDVVLDHDLNTELGVIHRGRDQQRQQHGIQR
jgi:ribosomal protein L31E